MKRRYRDRHRPQPQSVVQAVEIKPISKAEFIINYLMAKANTRSDNFDTVATAKAASAAWDKYMAPAMRSEGE